MAIGNVPAHRTHSNTKRALIRNFFANRRQVSYEPTDQTIKQATFLSRHPMPHCVFLTIENQQGWFIDDDIVHQPLQELGWEISAIPWTQKENWDRYDIVVIRSTWDYQNDLTRFLSVLEQIDSSSATLLNPLETVKWNIDKHYLLDLDAAGIGIVPTVELGSVTESSIRGALARFNSSQIVVKPTIGANADDTYRIGAAGLHSKIEQIEKAFGSRPCFAQPFMPSIVSEGEFSLVYLNGCFSHAVLKTACDGDFRVQEEHGGAVANVAEPASHLLDAGNRVVSSLQETPLYARVDFVRSVGNDFALMELELIEPGLFFRNCKLAATRFAAAIEARYLQEHEL